MIDAHIHLDRFADPVAAWQRLQEAGLRGALVPGVEEPYQAPAIEGIDFAYGQHPLFAAKPGWDERLTAAIEKQKPMAVGELGFDRKAGIEQIDIAAAQIDIAAQHSLPIIVHLVGDGGPLRHSLSDHNAAVMLHRCSGRPSRFEAWWQAGTYISVGPTVGQDLRLLSAVPNELLLLESDAEDEAAAPWDTLPQLYAAAARAKQMSLASIKALVFANYARFLGVRR